MSPRGRKAVGLLAFVVGLTVYALLMMRLGVALPQHWAVALVFYPVAGLAWLYPAARLIRWMQAMDP